MYKKLILILVFFCSPSKAMKWPEVLDPTARFPEELHMPASAKIVSVKPQMAVFFLAAVTTWYALKKRIEGRTPKKTNDNEEEESVWGDRSQLAPIPEEPLPEVLPK